MAIFAFICDFFFIIEYLTAVKASTTFYFETNVYRAVIAGEGMHMLCNIIYLKVLYMLLQRYK